MTNNISDATQLNPSDTHVPVVHPETNGRWDCPVGFLEVAKKQGWKLAQPAATDQDPGAADKSQPESHGDKPTHQQPGKPNITNTPDSTGTSGAK